VSSGHLELHEYCQPMPGLIEVDRQFPLIRIAAQDRP
jgi:hypothetical protein